MAVRAYHQSEGRLPNSLAELTPAYLATPADDPFSSESLRYLPAGGDFLLYSVGPDGIDNGGQPPQPAHAFEQSGTDIKL
ncbi:MAG: hypothetical protein K8R36_01540 [Planctomycetales bacterium]|nr:hypothetical protein [Planctomycetales bacterium]